MPVAALSSDTLDQLASTAADAVMRAAADMLASRNLDLRALDLDVLVRETRGMIRDGHGAVYDGAREAMEVSAEVAAATYKVGLVQLGQHAARRYMLAMGLPL